MSELREAAQAIVDELEDWISNGLIADLRAALAQPETDAPRDEWRPASEPPEDAMFSRGAVAAIVAGAIYDFAGFMTTRSVSVSVGASEACGPVVDLITSFAEKRGLDLEDAAVQSWNLCVGRDVQPPTEGKT